MNKKIIISNIMIGIGLCLIFGTAAHNWGGGLLVGICYFVCSSIIMKR